MEIFKAIHTFNLFQVARLNDEYSKSIELLRRAHTITLDHYGSKSVNTASSNQLLAGAYLLLWQNDNTKSLLEEAKKLLGESLQVYQDVRGASDPETLKCHVSWFCLWRCCNYVCATERILQITSIDGATHGALIRMSRTETSTVLAQIFEI